MAMSMMRSSGIGGTRTYRRYKGSLTTSSAKPLVPVIRREWRMRPSRASRKPQRLGSGRKEKARSACRARRWGGATVWKPWTSKNPSTEGAWRDLKRRRNARAETTRRKDAQAADARVRSAASLSRRKISSNSSSGKGGCAAAGAAAIRRAAEAAISWFDDSLNGGPRKMADLVAI
uniref:Uncharacterized protein n=1 Tax=Setaria italica TaxID=4555 RepID=K3ZBX9_SETIT